MNAHCKNTNAVLIALAAILPVDIFVCVQPGILVTGISVPMLTSALNLQWFAEEMRAVWIVLEIITACVRMDMRAMEKFATVRKWITVCNCMYDDKEETKASMLF